MISLLKQITLLCLVVLSVEGGDERNCSYWQMVFTSIDRAFENHSSVNDSTFYPSYKRIMEMAIDGMNDLNCSNIPTIPDDLKTVNITNYNWHE
ncbi:Uncharacterised protein g3750 [Pycnogonum litorale]